MSELTMEQIKAEKETVEKAFKDKTMELGQFVANVKILEHHLLGLNMKYNQLEEMEKKLKDAPKIEVAK